MIRFIISTLKQSKLARGVLIAALILLVPICLLGALIGIPVFIPIILVLAAVFACIPTLGMVGKSASQVMSLKDNKQKLDKTLAEAPEYADLERERARLQKLNLIFWIGAVALVLVLFAALQGVGLIIGLLAAGAVYLFWLSNQNKSFTDSFKQRIVLAELQRAFDNVTFEPGKSYKESEIKSAAPMYADNAGGDDWVEADRNGLHFCRSDVYLNVETTTTDDEGNQTTSTERVFGGILLRLPLAHAYDSAIGVSTKTFNRGVKDNVETESIEFERRMNVHADDQLTARLLLTPQMMESILQLEDAYKQSFCLVYLGSYLYAFLGTPEGNSFEINLKDGVSVLELRTMVEAQVARLCLFLDNLKLPNVES